MLSRATSAFCRARLPTYALATRRSLSSYQSLNDGDPSGSRTESMPTMVEESDSPSGFMNIPPLEDPLLVLFTGMIMTHGQKAKASRIVSRTLLHLYALTRAPPLPILRDGLLMVAPLVGLKRLQTTRMKHVMVPVALTERRSLRTAIEWLREECREPGPLPFEERLAREIIDIHNGQSKLLRKKEEVHLAAALNRANVTLTKRKY